MSFSGHLTEVGVPKLLHLFTHTAASGVLLLSHNSQRGIVSIDQGAVQQARIIEQTAPTQQGPPSRPNRQPAEPLCTLGPTDAAAIEVLQSWTAGAFLFVNQQEAPDARTLDEVSTCANQLGVCATCPFVCEASSYPHILLACIVNGSSPVEIARRAIKCNHLPELTQDQWRIIQHLAQQDVPITVRAVARMVNLDRELTRNLIIDLAAMGIVTVCSRPVTPTRDGVLLAPDWLD